MKTYILKRKKVKKNKEMQKYNLIAKDVKHENINLFRNYHRLYILLRHGYEIF